MPISQSFVFTLRHPGFPAGEARVAVPFGPVEDPVVDDFLELLAPSLQTAIALSAAEHLRIAAAEVDVEVVGVAISGEDRRFRACGRDADGRFWSGFVSAPDAVAADFAAKWIMAMRAGDEPNDWIEVFAEAMSECVVYEAVEEPVGIDEYRSALAALAAESAAKGLQGPAMELAVARLAADGVQVSVPRSVPAGGRPLLQAGLLATG